jgi:hypothetical protein
MLQRQGLAKEKPYIAAFPQRPTKKWEQRKAILKAEPKASDPAYRTGVFKAH